MLQQPCKAHGIVRASRAPPPTLVVGAQRVEGMLVAQLPPTVLQHRRILVDAAPTEARGPKAHLLEHADADLRGVTVGRGVDDRLQLHVIAEPTRHPPFGTPAEDLQEECANVTGRPRSVSRDLRVATAI
jgi:hypothetical protein